MCGIGNGNWYIDICIVLTCDVRVGPGSGYVIAGQRYLSNRGWSLLMGKYPVKPSSAM